MGKTYAKWALVLGMSMWATAILGCEGPDEDDPCKLEGRYGDGSCDLDCKHHDQDCDGQAHCEADPDDPYCAQFGGGGLGAGDEPSITIEALGADKLRLARGESTVLQIGTSQQNTRANDPEMVFTVLSGDGTVHVDQGLATFTAGSTLGPVAIELVATLPEGASDRAVLDLDVINLLPEIASFTTVPNTPTLYGGQELELHVSALDQEDGAQLEYAFEILGGGGTLVGTPGADSQRYVAPEQLVEVQLRALVTDTDGGQSTSTLDLVVLDSGAAAVVFTAPQTELVEGDEVDLFVQVQTAEDSGPTDLSYEIVSGDGQLLGSPSPQGMRFRGGEPGEVVLRVTATDVFSGRQTSQDLTLQVVANQAPAIAHACDFRFDFEGTTRFAWRERCGVTDANGDTVVAEVTIDGAHGDFVVDGDELVYTPDASSELADSVQLTLHDGRGATTPLTIATQVRFWQVLTSSNSRTFGLKTDGTLWGWGNNGLGELGIGGHSVNPAGPVQVGTDSDWAKVRGGYHHALALKQDGSLWAWGQNGDGQVGDGGMPQAAVSPVQIGSDTDWSSIGAGVRHSFAIKNDGSLWGWGDNGGGQLCTGDTDDRTVPVRIGTRTDWAAAVGTAASSAALRTDGTVWTCGDNTYARLGQGTQSVLDTRHDSLVWLQVGSATDWVALEAGEDHVLGLRDGGDLYGWGKNFSGQVGVGTAHVVLNASLVGTGFEQLAAGRDHSVALKSDGTLWSWGYNVYGQIGDGTRTTLIPSVLRPGEFDIDEDHDKYFPVQVGSATNWSLADAGGMRSGGLQDDHSRWGWGRNDHHILGLGFSADYVEVPTSP